MTSISEIRVSARRSRIGAFRVDILMMVLMILSVLGAGVGVFMMFEDYRNDMQYADKTQALVDRHAAQWSVLQEVAVEPCEVLGFRSEGRGMSSAKRIQELLARYDAEGTSPSIFSVDDNVMQELSSPDAGPDAGPRRSPDGKTGFSNAGRKTIDYREIGEDFRNHLFGLYRVQGVVINRFIDQVHNVNEARRFEFGRYLVAQGKRAAALKDKREALRNRRSQADEQLNSKAVELDLSAREAGNEISTANMTFLSGVRDMRDQRRLVDEARYAVMGPLADAARTREAASELLARRIRAQTDDFDFDGKVVRVDQASGYVFINLGQNADVRTEQTFTVLRPSGQSGHRIVAAIRVKEVIDGNFSRCRIDSFDSAGDWPRPGDLIRNESFTTEPLRYYALIGQFGGHNTRYSRQQLRDLLARYGKIVIESPDDPNLLKVEVVVIGGNWESDPLFDALTTRMGGDSKLKEFLTVFKERDLLYRFGLTTQDQLR